MQHVSALSCTRQRWLARTSRMPSATFSPWKGNIEHAVYLAIMVCVPACVAVFLSIR
jgi:hypothetical protein